MYFCAIFLVSGFYVFADLGKAIIGLYGLIQGVFAAATILSLLWIVHSERRIYLVGCNLLFAAMQIPPFICWIVLPGIHFSWFHSDYKIGWIGLAAHLILLAWGATLSVLLLGKGKDSRPQDRRCAYLVI